MKATTKVHLNIGMITLPVALYSATNDRNDGIDFNQLHRDCGNKINLKKWCTPCNKELSVADIIKGHEIVKGEYVHVEEQELDQQQPESSRVVKIEYFAERSELDTKRIGVPYYVGPLENRDSFVALREAIGTRIGIGKIFMHGREKLIGLVAEGRAMALYVLRADHEARPIDEMPGYSSLPNTAPDPRYAQVAKRMIGTFIKPLDLSGYVDTYRENVKALIAAKHAGQPVVVPQAPRVAAPQNDFLALCEASIREAETEKAIAKPVAQAAPEAKATAKKGGKKSKAA